MMTSWHWNTFCINDPFFVRVFPLPVKRWVFFYYQTTWGIFRTNSPTAVYLIYHSNCDVVAINSVLHKFGNFHSKSAEYHRLPPISGWHVGLTSCPWIIELSRCEYMAALPQWLLLGRWHFQMDFHGEKCVYCYSNANAFIALDPVDNKLVLVQGLSPARKIAAISHTTFTDAFSWMKMLEVGFKFHWNLFLMIQLTISQHWFRKCCPLVRNCYMGMCNFFGWFDPSVQTRIATILSIFLMVMLSVFFRILSVFLNPIFSTGRH